MENNEDLSLSELAPHLPASMPPPTSSNSVSGMKLPGPTVILNQAWEIFKNRFWVLLFISLLPMALMIKSQKANHWLYQWTPKGFTVP